MRENFQSIQFLRFAAALLVVCVHITLGLSTSYPGSISDVVDYLTGFGAVGVHVFFVISGFVMVYASFTTPQDSLRPSKFYARRFIRIYPIYWIYATIYLLFHNTFSVGYDLSWGQLIGAYLLLPGYSALIIGPGWTLAFEVYFYFCFGLVMALGFHRGLIALSGLFFAVMALRYVLGVDVDQKFLDVFTNSLLIEFLFGAWIGHLVVLKTPVNQALARSMLFSGIALFVAGLAYGYTRLPSVLAWGIPSALVIAGFAFSERNGRIPGVVSCFSWLGDSSYSLYLLHVLLIDVLLKGAVRVLPNTESSLLPVVAFPILALASVMAGVACYRFIEKPIVRGLRGLVKAGFRG